MSTTRSATKHLTKAAKGKPNERILHSAVILLQPTCIDEYRLSVRDHAVELTPRFYPRENYSASLSSYQGCSDNVIYDDLPPGVQVTSEDVQASQNLAETAASFIENQVTARDLQLVSQSTHIIVYRPRFNGNLSGGVSKEISHFRQLCRLRRRPDPRLIFLDSRWDQERFAPRQFVEALTHTSEEGRFNVSMEPAATVDYLARLTPATCQAINAAAEERTETSTRTALNMVLKDLAIATAWSVGVAKEATPLADDDVFSGQQEQKTRFST